MSINILMPALSPTMTEGALQKWFVKEGDEVKAGDVIAEIETDKATMEIEAVDEGTITKILVKEGTENVLVNSIIAILNGNSDAEINNDDRITNQANNNQDKNLESKKDQEDIKLHQDNKKFDSHKESNFKILSKDNKKIASPYAKKIAKDKNINLLDIDGSGPNGRIIKRDFEKITKEENKFISYSKYEILEPSNIRKVIAKRTTETNNTVPHFYLTIESNVDKLIKLKEQINHQQIDIKISINDILVKALALAQRKNPQSNISWFNNKIIKYLSVDVSIAVALRDGLVTPIVTNADKKGLLEISTEIKDLVAKANQNKLKPEEYIGGTISISNLGMYGINEFKAIINPPQSMILAVGSITKNLKINYGKINEVNILKSTLSVDHRALDGSIAAKFLKDFNDIIENPFDLWIDSNDMEII